MWKLSPPHSMQRREVVVRFTGQERVTGLAFAKEGDTGWKDCMTSATSSGHTQSRCSLRRWFLACVVIIGAASSLTTECLASQDRDNPPGRVARISYLRGNVSFLPAGQNQWTQATLNYVVTTGDRLYTDHGARAELEIGPYTIRLSEQTDLSVTDLSDDVIQLGLTQGSARLSVYQLPANDTVEIDTPNGALNVRAKGTYRVDVDPNAGRTLVTVNKGKLDVSGGDPPGTVESVGSGEAALLTGQNPIQVDFVAPPPGDDFDKWSDERDQRLSAAKSAKYVNAFAVGFDDLDYYGRWEIVADYGPVWYPTVPAGWVPYRFGQWAWIDPWGWTWIEDEAWGFCPFHYGRWVFIAGVWGWLPGPPLVAPIYVPALVAFLGESGFFSELNLVAWFPLGPVDTYFPWYHCTRFYLQEVNVTNVRNVTAITNILNTTSVNDIHYAYKNLAATAVPAKVFADGQPVAHHVVRVSPEQLAKAQVTPHPPANPTSRAVTIGKPVPPPPVHATRLRVADRIVQAASQPRPVQNRRPPPPIVSGAPRSTAEAATPRPRSAAPGEAPSTAPRVIVRTPPPPALVPFERRREVMAEHPGRPLEPVQLDNLRAGRRAGPMLDKEFPPHPVPIVREPLRPPIHRMEPAKPKFIGIPRSQTFAAHAVQI